MQRTNPSKNQNCWYFIRPMQKTRLSENRTQSMHPDKQGALINQQIKNAHISLDESKKTIPPKVCTLTILGLHALARWRSRQNCWKTIGFTTLRAPHSRWRKWRQIFQNTLIHCLVTLGCLSAKERIYRILEILVVALIYPCLTPRAILSGARLLFSSKVCEEQSLSQN